MDEGPGILSRGERSTNRFTTCHTIRAPAATTRAAGIDTRVIVCGGNTRGLPFLYYLGEAVAIPHVNMSSLEGSVRAHTHIYRDAQCRLPRFSRLFGCEKVAARPAFVRPGCKERIEEPSSGRALRIAKSRTTVRSSRIRNALQVITYD